MKLILYTCLALLFIYSCGSKHSDYSGELSDALVEKELAAPVPPPESGGGEQTVLPSNQEIKIEKKIIKDASVGIETENYENYIKELNSLVEKFNAYISINNMSKDNYQIRSDIKIRVPAQNFDNLITGLTGGDDKILYKNISARDVTEEFIDIEARLKTKKEVEKRYIQLLAKARNVKEILEVEEKLGRIREEIESTEGRLKYLQKQVSFSTINLNLSQKFDYKYQPEKTKKFFQSLISSLDKGWKGFIIFILFLFKIWPLFFILALVLYVIKLRKRKK